MESVILVIFNKILNIFIYKVSLTFLICVDTFRQKRYGTVNPPPNVFENKWNKAGKKAGKAKKAFN